MFETAELGHKLKKREYESRVPELRMELLRLQFELARADFPVLILINGVDGAGKGDTANLLHEWMDARLIRTYAVGPRSDEERERPLYWRFWRAIPRAGQIGVFFGSWYTKPILERVVGKGSDANLRADCARINAFEKALVDDGALVIKLWFHLSKKQQRKRFKKLESDPETSWRVTKTDWKHAKVYDKFREVCAQALRLTSTGEAPWIVVEGADARYRSVTVAETLIHLLRGRLGRAKRPTAEAAPLLPSPPPGVTILDTVDLDRSLAKREYNGALEHWQGRLNRLSRKAVKKNIGVIALFEGWDAAGKGGCIRRITQALDARYYNVIQVSAPTDEEKAHHYLWRFWRHLPRLGMLTIYDRSWYGRVLVERVEGLATGPEWLRAYHEINDFEEQLVEFGIVLVKFWLHVSKEEQLRRFKERETNPFKRYKITDEDYRNREKWDAYRVAADDMIGRTSTEYAPWTLVAANDKRHARIQVLEQMCASMKAAL